MSNNTVTQTPQTASNNRFENHSHNSSLTSFSFSILDHLDKLTEDGGTAGRNEISYHCPACGAENFKVNQQTG